MKAPRVYYVDWCRAIGIHVTVVEHLTDSLDKATDMAKNSANYAQWKLSFLKFLMQIGVPIFFYLSGVSVTFFDTEKPASYKRFMISKVGRLVIPLIVIIFVMHIPRHYFSQGWDDIGRLDNMTRIENDFFAYYP